ncbi:Helix-turn-helix transcriptional regulator (plasmid) [Rhodovastum atsumiense]|uniref:Helix-turn-helix transcriptional regulator n=1 Tax=Rhodovastum atsumiense TaxID=504468 RepID=A0A5M6IN50_9PROT|nr:helix-turn-helix transcriptional regulator [Rhodovastum atsumiense]KAA5609682.1 helix-turn-helix transcriptional regulator [Rhodovastum atsumiense]CAH2606449.1 Helix-turn-helix transcriptional regulator [Rhodovastum atsumiense]
MALGQRISELMKARGMDQSALARTLGIKSQSVNQWIAGRTAPGRDRLPAIAGALGVSVADLIDDRGGSSEATGQVGQSHTDNPSLPDLSPELRDALRVILLHLGIKIDYTDSGTPFISGPLPGEFVKDPDELALLRFWRGLDHAQRILMTQMLEMRQDHLRARG